MAKNAFKLSTIVGENFEIYFSQMAKNALKLSLMVGGKFEIYSSQIAKNAFKLSTMVGENFEIYCSYKKLRRRGHPVLYEIPPSDLPLACLVAG